MATQPDDDFQWEVEEEVVGTPQFEIEDDTPEADRNRAPMPKDIVDELENDELEEYSDKVKTRLKQMKKVWHDERREKERYQREQTEAVSIAQRYLNENRQLKNTLSQGEMTLLQTYQQTAAMEAAEARRAYKEAYEQGDSDKVVDANEKLATANYRVEQLRNYKPTLQELEYGVPSIQEQVNVPRPDQKTVAWQERNTWWGTDPEMTATALGIHQKLESERGQQHVGSDEYWGAIDTTMRRRFPEYFGGPEKQPSGKTTGRPANVVASASRSTSSKKIVLKQSELTIAKKLGLTPEQYAREAMKMER